MGQFTGLDIYFFQVHSLTHVSCQDIKAGNLQCCSPVNKHCLLSWFVNTLSCIYLYCITIYMVIPISLFIQSLTSSLLLLLVFYLKKNTKNIIEHFLCYVLARDWCDAIENEMEII